MKLKLFKKSRGSSDRPNKEKNDMLLIDNLIISTNKNSKKLKTKNLQELTNNNKKQCETYKNKWKFLKRTFCCYKCGSDRADIFDDPEMLPLNQDPKKKHILLGETLSSKVSGISKNPNPAETKNLDSIECSNRKEFSLMSRTFSVDSKTGANSVDLSFISNNNLKPVKLRHEAPQLYPPGRILHVVRKYPHTAFDNRNSINVIMNHDFTKLDHNATLKNGLVEKKSVKFNSLNKSMSGPVYQVIENSNNSFNELLISPRMLHDHMPENLIKCMRAVLDEPAPKKPPRQAPKHSSDTDELSYEENSMTDFSQFQPPFRPIPVSPEFNCTKRTSTDLLSCIKNTSSFKQYCVNEKILRLKSNEVEKIRCLSMYAAPLAKPESFSDIMNDCEAKEKQMNLKRSQRAHKSKSYHPKRCYLDTSLNNQTNLDEEELKSNLIWWPYSESNSSTQINSTGYSKIHKSKYDTSCENLENKCEDSLLIEDCNLKNIVINIEESEMDRRDEENETSSSEHRIATSTPRNDHLKYSNNHNNNKTSICNSLSLNEDNFNVSSSQQFLSIMSLKNRENFNIEINAEIDAQLSDSSENKFINDLNIQNISDEQSFSKSSNFLNESINESTTNCSNLDSSIDRSLSFGYSANLNDSLIKEGINSNKTSSLKKNFVSNSKMNDKSVSNNIQNDLNYTSIEKLDILKPQSKDYILCFDTSSIEQNSSCASDSDNLLHSHSTSKKNCSIEISEALSSKADSLKQKTTECSDSGLDTARSPISNSHDTVLEDCESSTDNTDKMID